MQRLFKRAVCLLSSVASCATMRWIGVMLALVGSSSSPAADLEEVVSQSFAATHNGWSSDEVLVHDQRNQAFLEACRQQLPDLADRDFNWTMLNLRKAKKLPGEVTKRKSHQHDTYRHAAEIAARQIEDCHGENIDRALCDTALRQEFDQAAHYLAPKTSSYLLRKAAIGLRKSHQLKPELVVRVADWGRTVTTFALRELQGDLEQIPKQPGVYLFADSSGYLYIGEAADLRKRLSDHLHDSDRPTLAKYLAKRTEDDSPVRVEIHAFDSNSAARQVAMRRAYESELIRSRKPKFNVRP